jgi:outer membrane protein OmpA-like peptidoglycan-associated protein/outer membrane protein W
VAATVLAAPVAANAQPITGLYIGGGAGATILQDEKVHVNGQPGGKLQSHFGPAGYLSLGYGLGNGLRAEIEGDILANDYKGFKGAASGGGHEWKYGPMVNVLYDFVGLTPYVQPYVGVGAGYQFVKEKNLAVGAPVDLTGTNSESKGSFAYQGIVGAAFPLAPAFALTVDYRFMGLTGNRNFGATSTFGGVAHPVSVRFNEDYSHTFQVGFILALNAEAPPPMAPPPAAVAPSPVSRSYLVFFDWDKADLTERARQIVSEAAANSTKVQYTQLEVNGYTDTSGTPKYNQGLSIRRAKAVAAELVKDGVPKSAIAIQGFGETHLLVATGPGVREPQNRRVEIIIK